MTEWKEVKPTGFWDRLWYGLVHDLGGEFAPDAEYVNEHGVRRFIRASDGQSRIDANSLLRSPKVRAHMLAMDRLVKSHLGVSQKRFTCRKHGKRKKRRLRASQAP